MLLYVALAVALAAAATGVLLRNRIRGQLNWTRYERRASRERLRLVDTVFAQTRDGIMLTDASPRIIDVNPAFTRITGYTRDQVIGRDPSLLNAERPDTAFHDALWRTLREHGHWQGEVWNRHRNGERYPALLDISAVRDDTGQVRQYAMIFSEIAAQQRQLERNARYDALTGLPNRALLAERLREAMAHTVRRGCWLGIAVADLDGFKTINDDHGRATGDRLLIAIAHRLQRAVHETDTIARIGGDELAAVLNDLDHPADCEVLLQRLLAAIARPVNVNGQLLRVSGSIGVTFYPQAEAVDADQLLRQADRAMYQAKLAGKNCRHVFDPELDRHIRGHFAHRKRLRQAMRRRELALYYQPKVNLRRGTVIGVEALLRWRHPERGLLTPAAFLPDIAGHALDIELGEWVIDQALTQLEDWQRRGVPVRISVNISAYHLQQTTFADRLYALLSAHPEAAPDALELEVLESAALDDMGRTAEVIAACHRFGVSFALDDFGTGYSSLAYLKHLPVHCLKVDQCFVRNMLIDPSDLAILEGVLGLSEAFRCETIAEGVESALHGEALLWLGYELAQGYGIARPMPACDYPAWQAHWRPDPRWAETPRLSHDLRPLLYGVVEHRAWRQALEQCLADSSPLTPPLPDSCRFELWLERQSAATLAELAGWHRQVHERGEALLTARRAGQELPEAELTALREQCAQFVAQLLDLIRAV